MICPNCGKSTTLRESNPQEYRRRKIANAHASLQKAKRNGNKMGKKPRFIDWEYAHDLREKYFTKAKIGRALGVSRQMVCNEFKKRGWK